MNYQISLEKTSKKHVCPSCNKKRYVRFINNETNEYLDYNYGRCDRETSCGYFKKPNDLGLKTLSQNEPIKLLPISTIQKSIIEASIKKYENNNLFLFLIKYFNSEQVSQTFKKYNVGTSKKWNGATVFWQLDEHHNFRTGKIMLYDTKIGKRVKKPHNRISWAHKVLKINNFNLKQCLFGLHLVKENTKIIGLVESEKTALIMSLFLPEHTWISTGSKQNLKAELLAPLKNFEIVAYPDKGEYNDWNKKCNELINLGFNISCSQLVEKYSEKQGYDLADIYFELENLKIDTIKQTKTEKISQNFYSKNPSIKNLIETFSLTDESGNIIRLDLNT
ncbi:DUF6371 domain-containing protein [Lutibacter sp.]|uniref:DUF6371 domain-containing protein n=1 Tax=Lutibacter sp. TaxID=1925666 RepID=UPI0035616587